MMNKCVIINLLQVWLKVLVKFLGVYCLLFLNLYGMDDTYFKQIWQEYIAFKTEYRKNQQPVKSFGELQAKCLSFEYLLPDNAFNKDILFREIADVWLTVEDTLIKTERLQVKGQSKSYPSVRTLMHLIKINELFHIKMLFFKGKHKDTPWYAQSCIPLKYKKEYVAGQFLDDIGKFIGSNTISNHLIDRFHFYGKSLNVVHHPRNKIVSQYRTSVQVFALSCCAAVAFRGCYLCGIRAPIFHHLLVLAFSGWIAEHLYNNIDEILKPCVYLYYKDWLFPNLPYVKKVSAEAMLHFECETDDCTFFKDNTVLQEDFGEVSDSDKNKSLDADNDSIEAINTLLSRKVERLKKEVQWKIKNESPDSDNGLRCGTYVRSMSELRVWLDNDRSTIYFNNSYFSCLVACILDGKKNNITMENNKLLSFVESLGRYQKGFYPQLKNIKQSSFIWGMIFCFLNNNKVHAGSNDVACNEDLTSLKQTIRDDIKKAYTIENDKGLFLMLWVTFAFFGNLSVLLYFYDQNILFHSKLALHLWSVTGVLSFSGYWFYKRFRFTVLPYPPDSFYDE